MCFPDKGWSGTSSGIQDYAVSDNGNEYKFISYAPLVRIHYPLLVSSNTMMQMTTRQVGWMPL